MAEIKDLTRWVPLKLLLWGVLASIFVGLQEMLQLTFACPCNEGNNVWFGVMFFLLPGVFFSALNVAAWHCGRCFCGKTNCHELAGLDMHEFWPRLLLPFFMWLTAVFLDGDAFACMTTSQCSYVTGPDLIPCRLKDASTPDSSIRCYRYWAFVSKLIGLGMLVLLVFAGLALKFSYKCGKECSCWEEDWKINYKEEALKRNEHLLMEVLLDRTKDDTKEKLTEALECKKGFWAEAEVICKDVRCPEDDEPID